MDERLWNAYMCISRKIESDGKGTDYTPIEQFIPYVDEFKEYCPPDKYKNILNIGAGGGGETKLLVDAGYKVAGITLGKDNIKFAKKEYGLNLMEFDMHYLNFSPDTFDVIFMIQTQEHALSSWIFALEMYFVLKTGGRIYTDLPSPRNPEMMKTIWHTNVLYPDQIRAMMWKAGFKEINDFGEPDRYRFLFEKLGNGNFPMWGYVQHIYNARKKIYLEDGTRSIKWNKND